MNILLVRPPRIKQAVTLSHFMFSEPLGLEMIYGVFARTQNVEIFDMMVETLSLEEKMRSFQPDRVGITSLCIDVIKVLELCERVKRENSEVVTFVGGTQALLSPDSFFDPTVDFVFNYTTEANLEAFLKNSPHIEGVYQKQNAFKDLFPMGKNEYLLPHRESTAKYRDQYSYFGYRPAAIMGFGIGCKSRCKFCLRWRIEGYEEVLIPAEITLKDLMQIKEETIMFIDNDFLASEEKLSHFLDLAESLDLKKNYIVYGSVRGVLEVEELLERFVALGLKAILIGFETFNDEELKDYHKNVTTEANLKASKILKSLGVDIWASFMAHPDWSVYDFKTFRRYIKSLAPEVTTINPLTPFPGLPLYEAYEDRLLYKKTDYEQWSFGQMIICPSQMSIRRYYFELMKTYLYVNLFVNGNTDMLKKYGFKNVFRIGVGTIRASWRYIKLMLKGPLS